MAAKEYCRYVRSYSEIRGFQQAFTLCYSASAVEQGVVLEVRREQQGRVQAERAFCPVKDFGKALALTRYLCENGVGLGQWQGVMEDVGLPCWPCTGSGGPQQGEIPGEFVAFAGFDGNKLVHNTELTQSV